MFPWSLSSAITRKTFLCLRRGVSEAIRNKLPSMLLFSAYAEVFPAEVPPPEGQIAFLCLRRGVSEAGAFYATDVAFSLPTQRCF